MKVNEIFLLIVLKRDLTEQDDQSEFRYYITDDSQSPPRGLHEQFAAEELEIDKPSSDSLAFTAPASSTVGVNQIENVTIKVGQQAILPCFVSNLGSFKVNFS